LITPQVIDSIKKAKQFEDIIYTFNLTYTNDLPPHDSYEHVHLIAVISGLANRNGVKFFYFYNAED